jgi:two-component sensor histidine kinase
VSIDFLGLGASLGEELKYQYKLGIANSDWIQTTQRTVDFANLAPGSYRFQVRAVAFDGLVSQTPATVSFHIAAPIWQRWWFIALAITSIAGLTYSFYRYRLNRLLEVERVRTRIASDLHDDIGSNLTKIAILSEVANRQFASRGDDSDTPLASIARISRESVASMSDIVWAINPKRDRLRDVTRRFREFASDIFTGRDIAFVFRGPDSDRDLELGPDVRRDVLLIYKEAVNNVARHSACARAAINVALENGWFVVNVSDDGRGFDSTIESDGNGLASMRKRAERVQGQLNIDSHPGRGTTVTLRVPVGRR